MNNIYRDINSIIENCSKKRSSSIPRWQQKHPWLSNLVVYDKKKQLSVVRSCFREFRKKKDTVSKHKWISANSTLITIFSEYRDNFMTNAVNNSKGNTRQFYQLLNSKKYSEEATFGELCLLISISDTHFSFDP